jgi:diguanylate cyclase (GGDEF)-like protein
MPSQEKDQKLEDYQCEIIDNFREAFCRWTPDMRLLKANAAFFRLMNFERGGFLHEDFTAENLPLNFYGISDIVLRQCTIPGVAKTFEYRVTSRESPADTDSRWLNVSARLTVEAGVKCYDTYLLDISDTMDKEKELLRQGFYDDLTALPNRALFLDRVKIALRAAKRNPASQYAVLNVDVHDLSDINQYFGYDFGDMLLRHVASSLRSCCREADTVARVLSDEFALLLHGPTNEEQVLEIIQRIIATLDVPFSNGSQSVNSIKLHIGAIFPMREYDAPEDVLRDAHLAVCKAKESKANSVCEFFSQNMLKQKRNHLSLLINMQQNRCLEEFYLMYQPIVKAHDGGLRSFEALVRWRHNGRAIPPDVFIPMAEKGAFIQNLGAFVMEQACRQMAIWQDKCRRVINMHINISPRQLAKPDFAAMTLDILRRVGVDAAHLYFEVTESVFLQDIEPVTHNINIFREQGIRLCLDDFGTGYSSLSYLKKLPFDCLKIDRSFVSELTKCDTSRTLFRHILALSRDMGYKIVVEGVETQDQLSSIQIHADLLIQGWYFYKPLSATAATALLEKQFVTRELAALA